MSYNPEEELTVGELYGTRHPRNQLPDDDDFAFRVRGIDKEANELEVEFVLVDGNKNVDPDTEIIPYEQYQDQLTNPRSPFTYLG